MEGCRHVGVDVNTPMLDLETSTEDSEDEHDFPPGSVNRRCDELIVAFSLQHERIPLPPLPQTHKKEYHPNAPITIGHGTNPSIFGANQSPALAQGRARRAKRPRLVYSSSDYRHAYFCQTHHWTTKFVTLSLH